MPGPSTADLSSSATLILREWGVLSSKRQAVQRSRLSVFVLPIQDIAAAQGDPGQEKLRSASNGASLHDRTEGGFRRVSKIKNLTREL